MDDGRLLLLLELCARWMRKILTIDDGQWTIADNSYWNYFHGM